MKTTFKILSILILITNFSCKNETTSTIKYHKSHLENRQNVPFSDAVQVGNLYFLSGQIGRNLTTGKFAEGGIETETHQTTKNIETVLQHYNLSYFFQGKFACKNYICNQFGI